MPAIRLTEEQLTTSGHQLDPVTGEISKIPQGVVWTMSDEEFAAHAASFNAAQCVEMIREAHKQVGRCFKRGAEWYYTVGRWLAWMKQRQAYAGWDAWVAFCQDECAISPAQASKYMRFAELYSPQQIESSFADERFSLERALGYKDKADGSTETETNKDTNGEVEEQSSTPADASATTEQEEDEEEEEAPKSEEEHKAGSKKGRKTKQPSTQPQPHKWKLSGATKPQVSVIYPGKFRFRFDDSHEFNLNREQVEEMQRELAAAIERDDELGKEFGNRSLPQRSVELQCPRLAEGTAQPVH